MINLSKLLNAAHRMPGFKGPIGKRNVGKVKKQLGNRGMNRLKKGESTDFIEERPEVNSKNWVFKQYDDDYVNKAKSGVSGYFAEKSGSKYHLLAEGFLAKKEEKMIRSNDRVLNLSHDPSGGISMFLASKLLGFDSSRLSISPAFLQKWNFQRDRMMRNLAAQGISQDKSQKSRILPSITTVTTHHFADKKYFDALESTKLFKIIKLPNIFDEQQALERYHAEKSSSRLKKRPEKLVLNQEQIAITRKVLEAKFTNNTKFSLIMI